MHVVQAFFLSILKKTQAKKTQFFEKKLEFSRKLSPFFPENSSLKVVMVNKVVLKNAFPSRLLKFTVTQVSARMNLIYFPNNDRGIVVM